MKELTSRRRGRPRAGFEKPSPYDEILPPWKKPGFVEKCRDFYELACREAEQELILDSGSPRPKRNHALLSDVAQITGDPLFDDDIVIFAGAYASLKTARRSRFIEKLASAAWGSDAEIVADYAEAFARNTGASLRVSIADALAANSSKRKPWTQTQIERTSEGARVFVRDNYGKPASFETAMRFIFATISDRPSGGLLGFTGKMIFVKPAIEGAVVINPDRDMRQLDPAGEWVADTLFWRRLILNGDVIQVP